jgi:hypothetical protein
MANTVALIQGICFFLTIMEFVYVTKGVISPIYLRMPPLGSSC